MALSHLGIAEEIEDLETDDTQEAKACRRFFDEIYKKVLRSPFPWPFATKIAALALVEEEPNDEWLYSYRYPADCFFFRRILSGMRQETNASRVPTKISRDDDGKLIFCDVEEAEAEYTVDVEEPADWDSDFVLAVSLLLASFIAPRFGSTDATKLGIVAGQRYKEMVGEAKAAAAEEEQPDADTDADSIRARD